MKRTVYLYLLFIAAVACAAPPQPTQDVDTKVRSTLTVPAKQQGNSQTSQPLVSQANETTQPEIVATFASPTLSVIMSTSDSTSGMEVSDFETHFTIPSGLAAGTQNEFVPQSNDPIVPFRVYPAYIKFTLQGYPLQGTAFEPQIEIYPAKKYAQMNEDAKAMINKLNNILLAKRTSPAEPLPFLPMINAGQVFHAQEKFLSFKNGMGIRYITQYDQAPLPINNTEIFYTFQGLTSEGNYYVSVIMPINLPFLPADNSVPSTTPPNGVPFALDTAKYPDYLFAITDRLNRLDNPINPPLESLDTLIQSLLTAGQ